MPLNDLIVNGGFETGGLSPWAGLGAAVNSSFSHSDMYSVWLSGDAGDSFISQLVPVVPEQAYNFSAALTAAGRPPGPDIVIVISFFDAAFNFLGTGLSLSIPAGRLPCIAAGEWLEVCQRTASAPAGSVQAYILIIKSAQKGASGVIVDDAALTEEAAPS